MARFGQGLIQALTNPSYQQGMFDLGSAIGSAPAQRRDQQAKSTAMTMVNEALASQDPDKLLQAANAIKTIDPATATKLSQAAGQLRAKAEESRLGRGLQGGLTAISTAASRGVPLEKLTEAQKSVIGLGGTQEQIMNAYKSGLKQPKDTEVYSGLTEWVDSSGNVVLKTIQPKNSPLPIELGSNRRISSQELAGLTKKKPAPGVSVSLGDKGNTKYEEGISAALAEQDAEDIKSGESAADNLATISEARFVLEESPEVLGLGSENIDTVKKGVLRILSGMGVTNNDPVYKNIAEQSSSVDLYRSFTQDFVEKRMDATKGAISDREYKSFIASVPNLMQTPEGYKAVLDYMERANTAAVLRSEHLRNAAFSEVSSKQSVYEARKEWNNFRRDFPLGTLTPKAMTDVWGDYNKSVFDKNNMVFSVIGPDGTRQLTTYKDIVEAGKNSIDRLTSASSIKRAFEKLGAVYVPIM